MEAPFDVLRCPLPLQMHVKKASDAFIALTLRFLGRLFLFRLPGVDPLLEAQAADAAPHGRLVDRPGVARHRHLDRPQVPNHRPEIMILINISFMKTLNKTYMYVNSCMQSRRVDV